MSRPERRVITALGAAIAVVLFALVVVQAVGPGPDPIRVAAGSGTTTIPGPAAGAPGGFGDVTTTTSTTGDATTTTTGVPPPASSSTSVATSTTEAPSTTASPETTTSTTTSTTACTAGDLGLAVSPPRWTYPPGAPVTLTLVETSTTFHACTEIRGSSQVGACDSVVSVTIVDGAGKDVYSPGACTNPPTSREALRPGQSRSYTWVWDQRPCHRTAPACLPPQSTSTTSPVPPGIYTAHTRWSGTGSAVDGPTAIITIG